MSHYLCESSIIIQLLILGMLSPDGACKSFDASGRGYCRSEAVVCVYLQKAQQARRVYATLVHSKTNSDGHKNQGEIYSCDLRICHYVDVKTLSHFKF